MRSICAFSAQCQPDTHQFSPASTSITHSFQAIARAIGDQAIDDARSSISIGSQKGAESVTVTSSELPAAGQHPLSDDQPSLAITYIIATTGNFPAPSNNSSFDSHTETLGQIAEFAGDFAPTGWALADGQLLSIRANAALFAVIGTTYGGDGMTTFALPNLDGRTTIGAGVNTLGVGAGVDKFLLTAGEIPSPRATDCP
jgi:microcystin-dependent protein